MAKVSNAATTSPSGLAWFKVSEDGLDGSGNWGVDRMISNGGWTEMTMPTCVAPGQYLLRAEMIALHSASSTGGAQFYMVRIPWIVSLRRRDQYANNLFSRDALKSTFLGLVQRWARQLASQVLTVRTTLASSLASTMLRANPRAMVLTRSLDLPSCSAREDVGRVFFFLKKDVD